MKAYPTQEQLKERFDYKDGQLVYKICPKHCAIKIGDIAGGITGRGYVQIGINGKLLQANRLVWIYNNGDIPDGLHIDHINGVKNDNRLSNLRLATHSQNMCNTVKRKDNTSKFKGVCFHKHMKKWRAEITASGKRKHLGYRDTKEAAYELYVAAANKLHGEFACLK
jgi:hypothetical protein